MSEYRVNVYVFGKDIDDLVTRVMASLDDNGLGELASIIGTAGPSEEAAVEERKRQMLKWCADRGSKSVAPSLVSQIIVKFIPHDSDSEPSYLRLIE